MSLNKRMYLIDQDQYDRLLKSNAKIPSQIELNQLQTKFVKDRTKDDVQSENLWSKIVQKIQPLIEAHANQVQQSTQANQSQQPAQIPPSAVQPPNSSFTPYHPTPISSFFPHSQPPLDDSQPVVRNLHEDFEQEAGAVGGESREEPDRASLIERDRRQSVLGDVLNTIPPRYRSRVISLYKTLVDRPGVRINDNKILIDGIEQNGTPGEIMVDLVDSKKKLKYHNPAIISVLSEVSDILFIVKNQEATWQILEGARVRNTPMRTPVPNTVKKGRSGLRPRHQKKNEQNEQNERNEQNARNALQRESLSVLQDWGKDHGIDIDTRYPIPDDVARELVRNKRGKGKINKRLPKIKWESLF